MASICRGVPPPPQAVHPPRPPSGDSLHGHPVTLPPFPPPGVPLLADAVQTRMKAVFDWLFALLHAQFIVGAEGFIASGELMIKNT